MERQFKGIFIPAEIWEDTNLTWNEKIVLMEIDSFTSAGKDCYISDEYIGKLVGCSTRTATTIVSKLIKLGYIKKTKTDGRHRFLEAKIAEQIRKNCGADTQNLRTTNNKITNISSIDIEDKRENKETRFVKPSVSEIREYCESRNNGIDPQEFYDFYESKGWMVGRSKMKDWKASVRTWEAKRKRDPQPHTPSPSAPKKESVVDYYKRILADLDKPNDHDRSIDEQ